MQKITVKVENKRLKARTQKRFEAKAKDWLSEDRPTRGQGHNEQVFYKKKVLAQKQLPNFPRNFKRSPEKKKKKERKIFPKFSRSFWRSPRWSKKKSLNHGPFLTIQNIVLSSAEDKGHFWGLVGFEAKAKDFKMCPRGLHLCKKFFNAKNAKIMESCDTNKSADEFWP